MEWSKVIQHCRDLHFDHIALPPIFAPGPAANSFLAGDIERADAQFGFGEAIEDLVGGNRQPVRIGRVAPDLRLCAR